MINYNLFLNEEAKVTEFQVGSVVFFRDCSFNEGRDYITNTKGIVTKIEKTATKPPTTLITFTFFEGMYVKSSITLNSRQLRKIEITGKDEELLKKIQEGKLLPFKATKELMLIFRKIRFQVSAMLLDKTLFDVDPKDDKNITYINSEDSIKEDPEQYRKSSPVEEIFSILNTMTVSKSGKKETRFTKDYIYETGVQNKIKNGEYVKVEVSRELQQLFNQTGYYMDRQYSDITKLDVDLDKPGNIKYIEVRDLSKKEVKKTTKKSITPDVNIKSENCGTIFQKLRNRLDRDSLDIFVSRYTEETQYQYDMKRGKLVPITLSQPLTLIVNKLYLRLNKTHYRMTLLDIDWKDPNKITYTTAENFNANKKDVKDSDTVENILKYLFPTLGEQQMKNYVDSYKREVDIQVKIYSGEIRKFEASKELLGFFSKIGFYVKQVYYDISRFDIDVVTPGNITFIPSNKIKKEKGYDSESFRQSSDCKPILRKLYPSLDEKNLEMYSDRFRKQVVIEIKLKRGEIAIYKASQAFGYIIKGIGMNIKEQYFDVTAFDIVEDNLEYISFIPAKKSVTENAEKSRQSTRAGRVFKKFNPSLTEVQIEKFVNLYRAEVEGYFNPPDIQVQTGEKIVYWYLQSRYASGGGSLNNSCMRGDGAQTRISFYAKFPDKIALATFIKNDKLYGRALLWRGDDGRVMMDRIYTVSAPDEVQFMKYATQHKIIMRNELQNSNNMKKIIVTLIDDKELNMNNIPYLDTMRLVDYGWVDADGKKSNGKDMVRWEAKLYSWGK